jgi:sirohydrochlorin cobaltochelatase
MKILNRREINMPEQNLLVIISYSPGDTDALANTLSEYLKIPVQPAYLEGAEHSIGESIQLGIAEHQPSHVIILPLFLGASAAKKNNVWQIVAAAQERWPDIAFYYGKPPGPHPGVVAAYTQLLTESEVSASETALLVVGRGSRDPESNIEIYQMARLLWEKFQSPALEVAFTSTANPDIATAVQWCLQAGLKRILVAPYLLYDQPLYQTIQSRIEKIQNSYPDIEMVVTPHLGTHDGIIEAVGERYQKALKNLTSKAPNDEGMTRLRAFSHSHGADGAHTHNTPSFALEPFLPPRYQGEVSVSAAPMGAADLIFDANGQVAWNEMWGSFCDLALAGGPPHRGTLLEPVSPEIVTADPAGYQRVLAELERGIRLITDLPVIPNRSLGWTGIQCTDEAMALWLLRAIIVENVSVRREDDVIYLPAGPNFRLEHEIKNIITVVAKTHHHWTEHITSKNSGNP